MGFAGAVMPAVADRRASTESVIGIGVSTLNAPLFPFREPGNSVVFKSGTPLTDNKDPVPEPSSLTLFGAGEPRNCGLIRRLTLRITSLVG